MENHTQEIQPDREEGLRKNRTERGSEHVPSGKQMVITTTRPHRPKKKIEKKNKTEGKKTKKKLPSLINPAAAPKKQGRKITRTGVFGKNGRKKICQGNPIWEGL